MSKVPSQADQANQSPPPATSERGAEAELDREWLVELNAQHRGLVDVFKELVSWIERVPKAADRDDTKAGLLRVIADAEKFLLGHFAFEEAGGYLSDVLAIAPRLSKRAAYLERDHRKLGTRFTKLAAIARDLHDEDESWSSLRAALREFTQELHLHELEENRLIQEAFLDDLGGG